MNNRLSPKTTWLYGSHARGDSDPCSDIDVLVINDDPDDNAAMQVASKLDCPIEKLDISFYSIEAIKRLAKRGSLFTWHIHDEGKPIYPGDGSLTKILQSMPNYRSHASDMKTLFSILQDAKKSIYLSDNSLTYDLGIISTAIRNAGIITSNYLGTTDYSPRAALTVSELCADLKLTLSNYEYELLLQCRRQSERELDFSNKWQINRTHAEYIVDNAKIWLENCLSFICEERDTCYAC